MPASRMLGSAVRTLNDKNTTIFLKGSIVWREDVPSSIRSAWRMSIAHLANPLPLTGFVYLVIGDKRKPSV